LHVIDELLIALLSGGHCLITGAPGLAKTLLIKTVADVCHLSFQRIQFTPDLMPSDITGTEILEDSPAGRKLVFSRGPVFANMILADEINRTPPKTQAALLEAMQEHQVTVNGKTMHLPEPFFVLATQNPIEQDGTYPLPEAQLDRFFFKLYVPVPSHGEFIEILNRTGGKATPEINAVATGDDILQMGQVVREVPVEASVQDYLVKIARATHPTDVNATERVKKYVRHGSSPRGAQTILAAARVRALLDGRYHVAREDIAKAATPALRHRILLSFEGEAEGVKTDEVIADVIEKVKA
jgi:MoxR-like ATPase